MKYNVIQDTREKAAKAHDFSLHENCNQCIAKKLDTGDYTIEGFENKLIIERKGSVSEIAMNLGANDRGRFERELERMKGALEAYIICEFSIEDVLDYPKGLPLRIQKVVKLSGKAILAILSKYEQKYGVKIIYCNDPQGAYDKMVEIMDEFYELFGR